MAGLKNKKSKALCFLQINDNIRKDGRTISCAWSNTPLRKKDGTVIGAMSMVEDVTIQKKTEEELKKYNRNLE